MPEKEEPTMTIQEAAQELAVTQAMVYRMIRDGKLEKTAEGTTGPDGESARVTFSSVESMKRKLITRLEKRLEKLRSGTIRL